MITNLKQFNRQERLVPGISFLQVISRLLHYVLNKAKLFMLNVYIYLEIITELPTINLNVWKLSKQDIMIFEEAMDILLQDHLQHNNMKYNIREQFTI